MDTPQTPAASPAPDTTVKPLRDRIIDVLKSCYDPEIPVDIYELGLIYEINISDGNDVHILMTLTSPACPVAERFHRMSSKSPQHTGCQFRQSRNHLQSALG